MICYSKCTIITASYCMCGATAQLKDSADGIEFPNKNINGTSKNCNWSSWFLSVILKSKTDFMPLHPPDRSSGYNRIQSLEGILPYNPIQQFCLLICKTRANYCLVWFQSLICLFQMGLRLVMGSKHELASQGLLAPLMHPMASPYARAFADSNCTLQKYLSHAR